MNKRAKILVSTLAITFLLMVIFIFTQHGGNIEQISPFLIFGVALVFIAIFSLKIEKSIFSGKNIIKIIMGSFALAFGAILLIGVLSLPFVGFKGLEVIMGHNTGYYWLALALVLSPITAKYLK